MEHRTDNSRVEAATSRQNRPSTRRALSLDPGASTCSECYYAYYLGDVHRSAFIEGDLERNFGSKCLPGLLHHRFMFFHVSNYTNQSASLESASCLRRKRDYVVAPESQADRPTFYYRTCIKHNQKRGTEMADSRGRRHELVEPEACATRRGAQRTSAASNQIPEE